ncbi:hypothetical protein FQZ97_1066640 [compost metagenome]
MRLGVLRTVGVALDRDAGNRPLEQVGLDVVARAIGRGQLGEVGRRHGRRIPLRNIGANGGHRQAAVAGVLEFLHAQRQGDVAGARGHRVDRRADRFRTAGAEVLHAGDTDVRQSQGDAHRRAAAAGADIFHVG